MRLSGKFPPGARFKVLDGAAARVKGRAMPDREQIDVEYMEPVFSDPCGCCGGVTVFLTRYFKLGGYPFAIGRLTFSEGHPEHDACALFGLATRAGRLDPATWFAFSVRMRPEGIMVVDATDEQWPDSEVLGTKLTREAALKHPLCPWLYKLVDELYLHDEALGEHFERVVALE